MWQVASGAYFYSLNNDKEYSFYLEKALLCKEATTSSNPLICKHNHAMHEIDKDIGRSFPEHPFYATTEAVQSLGNVLSAFSWRNLHVGYCQGMVQEYLNFFEFRHYKFRFEC
jgi:hypothetical protein